MSKELFIKRLKELSSKAPKRPKRTVRLTPSAFIKHDKKRIETAENLAKKIYDLSNTKRIIDIEAYISAINKSVLSKNSEDNQYILKYSQEYFQTSYSKILKKQGESTSMLDQIIKRTGKDSHDRISATLKGFNASVIAEKLWTASIEDLENLILECSELTDKQLSELITEFDSIPSKKISYSIKQCLNTSRPDLKSIEILLQNKTKEEIQKIISIYEEFYILKDGEDNSSFKDSIENLKEEDKQALNNILEGIDLNLICENIDFTLNNITSLYNVLAEEKSKEYGLILNSFEIKNSSDSLNKELYAKPFIESMIYFLELEQFEELNSILFEKFGYKLTSQLYSLNYIKTPISLCLELDKSINSIIMDQDLSKVVSRSIYKQCIYKLKGDNDFIDYNDTYLKVLAILFPLFSVKNSVQRSFNSNMKAIAGLDAIDLCHKLLKSIGLDKDSDIKNLTQILSNNLQHTYVKQDLANYVENFFAKQKDNDTDGAVKEIQKCIKERNNIKEKSLKLLNLFSSFNPTIIEGILDGYLKETEERLLVTISKTTTPATLIRIKNILKGFNTSNILDKINNSEYEVLFSLSPLEIALTDNEFKKEKGISLIDYFKREESKHIYLIPAYSPLTAKYKSIIVDQNSFKEEQANEFISYFKENKLLLKYFELSYDNLFSSFKNSSERTFGTFRSTITIRSLDNSIPQTSCVKLLSLLDNLPVDLTFNISDIIENENKDFEAAKKLHEIFKSHKNKMFSIKALYLLYNTEKSLREKLYEFNLIPTDSSLTLLLLDGYDPEKIIYEIEEYINTLSGNDLGERITGLLDEANKTIPDDPNWRGEMYHQIRIRYKLITGKELVETLKSKKIPLKGSGLNAICYKLYGEMAKKCVDLRVALFKSSDPYNDVNKIFKNLKAAELERAIDMYENYYTSLIEDDIKKQIVDDKQSEPLIKKALEAKQWENDYFKKD